MRVLWITTVPFAHHNDMLGAPKTPLSSGSWLYAAYESAKRDKSCELHIATVSKFEKLISETTERVTFHIIPGNVDDYDPQSPHNRSQWQHLYQNVKPDLLVLWGTESVFGYTALAEMTEVPAIVYIQGIVKTVVAHYKEGIPCSYRLRNLRDFINLVAPRKNPVAIYKQRQKSEERILNMVDGVIVENDWCIDQCRAINPKLKIFINKLPIRREFFESTWDLGNCERHTIFVNAGGSPIKGHHILYEALGIVKRIYPDVKVYIPGSAYLDFNAHPLRKTGDIKYLQDIYKKYDLSKNIVFTGPLNAEGMVSMLIKSNIFVMPSLVENHSSSLIEAMICGVPCISSLVGGVANLISHKENGLIYNSLDSVSLAGCIIRLFEDENLQLRISANALKTRSLRNGDFGEELQEIYKAVLGNKNE